LVGVGDEIVDELAVRDVSLDEFVAVVIGEIRTVAGVRECVNCYNFVVCRLKQMVDKI
jgi:hypothetical protein